MGQRTVVIIVARRYAAASEEESAHALEAVRREFPWWPGHASFSSLSVLRGLRFQPSASDVVVSTFVKTGTTWCCFIAHLLRSNASVDFEEISQVGLYKWNPVYP
jgi:hypothetical protein